MILLKLSLEAYILFTLGLFSSFNKYLFSVHSHSRVYLLVFPVLSPRMTILVMYSVKMLPEILVA